MGEPYNLTNENFLPMLSIQPANEALLKQLDVYDSTGNFDIRKLEEYFELRIGSRNRTGNKSLYTAIPFRQCREDDSNYNFK